MPQLFKLALIFSTALTVLSATARPGSAETLPIPNPSVSAAQDRATDIIILQNRLQRQQFQQQQQQFRQQDRQQVVPPQVQRPQVPTLDSDCRIEVFGNSYVKKCR